jgi:hypothetical protein
MIAEPRQRGSYSLRQLDCRRAIEVPVRVMLGGSAAPFYDFESLLHAILPAAQEVGWTEDEVQSALEAIVHDLRPTSRRN